jgi:NADPH:quinone reductase-like Zn-dependent oxidoreductase
VLVNGASGGVGTFAVQLAKAYGAETTGVCGTRNVDPVRSIGADHVIDYTREDFTRTGRRYDVIVDIAGNWRLSDIRRVVAPKGVLVSVGGPNEGRWIGPARGFVKMFLASPFVSQTMAPMLAKPNKPDLAVLRDFIEAGTVTPVVDRTYPLGEVPEAIRYLETGHAREGGHRDLRAKPWMTIGSVALRRRYSRALVLARSQAGHLILRA